MYVLKRLNQLLSARGWSGYRLMKESGLSASTISNIFSRKSIPSIPTLTTICDAMGITLAQFFNEGTQVPLSEEQIELVEQWSCLKPRQRELIVELMKTMHEE